MFVADAGTDVPKIYSVTDDGRVINVVEDAESRAPSYLSNGDLLFVRDVVPAPGPGIPPRGAIWTMHADGSDQRQLLPAGQAEGWTLVEQAVASPGGEWVAFSGIVDDSANRPRIYIVRSDGSQLRQVSGLDGPGTFFDEEVAWSSDGSALTFIRQAPRGETYYFELWVVDVEDTVDSQLLFGTSTTLTNISWGPGERILASEDHRDDSKGSPLPDTPAVLDWGAYRGALWATTYGIHHAATALRQINSNTKTWRNSLQGGLAMHIRDGDAADQRDQREFEAFTAQGDDTDDLDPHLPGTRG